MMTRRYPYEAAAPRAPSTRPCRLAFRSTRKIGDPSSPTWSERSRLGQVRNDGGTAPAGRAINWPAACTGVLAKGARGEASRLVTDARAPATSCLPGDRRAYKTRADLPPPTPSEQHALDAGSVLLARPTDRSASARYISIHQSSSPSDQITLSDRSAR